MFVKGDQVLFVPPRCGSTSLTVALVEAGWTYLGESWKKEIRTVVRDPLVRVRSMYRHHLMEGYICDWETFVRGLGHDPFKRPCSEYGGKMVTIEELSEQYYVPRLNVSTIDPPCSGFDEIIIEKYKDDYNETHLT